MNGPEYLDKREMARLATMWTDAQPAVAAFIRSVVRDADDAQELLQRTALGIVEGFERYDPGQSFTAWAIGIARHQVHNHWRTARRDRHVFNSDVIAKVAGAYERLAGESRAMQDALRRCVDTLDEDARQMIDLRYEQNLKPAEMANRLGRSANAISVALFRLRAALQRCVERRIGRAAGEANDAHA